MIDDPLVKTEKEDQENDSKPEDLPFDFVMYPFQWKTDACSKETDEGRSDVSFGSVCLENSSRHFFVLIGSKSPCTPVLAQRCARP